MRIVRDFFGADRTTVAYENQISGVGGNADEFFVVAEVEKNGLPAVRTAVHFTKEKMAHLLGIRPGGLTPHRADASGDSAPARCPSLSRTPC
jgi:hypothetical protein